MYSGWLNGQQLWAHKGAEDSLATQWAAAAVEAAARGGSRTAFAFIHENLQHSVACSVIWFENCLKLCEKAFWRYRNCEWNICCDLTAVCGWEREREKETYCKRAQRTWRAGRAVQSERERAFTMRLARWCCQLQMKRGQALPPLTHCVGGACVCTWVCECQSVWMSEWACLCVCVCEF